MNKSVFILVALIVIIIALGEFFLWDNYNYHYNYSAPQIFSIENTNATYTITYDKQFGTYILWVSNRQLGNYSAGSYIASSPVPLGQFVNKKVSIAGKFVLTKRTLTYPSYPNKGWPDPVGAVDITRITLVKE